MPLLEGKKHREKAVVERRKACRGAVNRTLWARLRAAYLHTNPYCGICAELGKLTPAVDVYRMNLRADERTTSPASAFDKASLIPLCKSCRAWTRKGGKVYGIDLARSALLMEEEARRRLKMFRTWAHDYPPSK